MRATKKVAPIRLALGLGALKRRFTIVSYTTQYRE